MRLSSRKFITALLILGLATATLWADKIDATAFRGILELVFMVYVGGNLGARFIDRRGERE